MGRRPGSFIPPRRVARVVTVKDRVGRVRYVAFRVDGGPLRRDAMSGALPPSAKLTRFDGTHGILRTGHTQRDELLSFLRGLSRIGGREVRVEPLTTSGTIRKAAEALPPGCEAARRVRPPRKDAKRPEP